MAGQPDERAMTQNAVSGLPEETQEVLARLRAKMETRKGVIPPQKPTGSLNPNLGHPDVPKPRKQFPSFIENSLPPGDRE